MSRYDAALGDVVRWLEIDTRGWGMVLVASSQQVEVAQALAALVAHRPHVELRDADGVDALDQILRGLADDSTGAFLTLSPTMTAAQVQRVLGELNSRRGWLADRGKWVMVLSQPDYVRTQRHAGDVTSIFGGLNRVPFIPRPMSDDDIVAARRELHDYYRGKFGRLDLRGFIRSEREDVSFAVEDIYQPLTGTSYRMGPVYGDDGEETAESRPYAIERREPLLNLIRYAAKEPLVLVGGPGSGKSFFLRWCALAGSRDAQLAGQDRPVPIYVPLAAMRAGYVFPSIEDYIVEDLLQAGLAIAHAFAAASRAGHVLYLLDGVDEVGSRRQQLVQDIEALAARNPRSRILLTSRPNGLEGLELQYDHVAIEGLTDDALRALLRSWCGLYESDRVGPVGRARGEADGAQLAEDVLASPTLGELARTPLLATIIAIVHRAGVRLPDHRVELYEHIVRILVERWNQLRSMASESPAPPIRTADAIRLLGPVAYELVERGGDGAIDESSLRSLIAAQLGRGTVRAFGDVDAAMATFRDTLGVIVEQAPGIYAFLHKSLAEFLAAHEAVRTGTLESVLVAKRCFDARWQEVILLALGIVGTIQVSDDRLASAVTKIVEGAHAVRPAEGNEVPVLLASIIADDPGLTPLLATSLCDELVPAWWFDAVIQQPWVAPVSLYSRIGASASLGLMKQRIAAAYGRGIRKPFASFDDNVRHHRLLDGLEAWVSIAPHLCEWMLRWCVQPWGFSGILPFSVIDWFVIRDDGEVEFAPSREQEGRLLVRLCTLGVHPIVFVYGRTTSSETREFTEAYLQPGAETIRFRNPPKHPSYDLQLMYSPPMPEARTATIPAILDIWRGLAEIYPDGPQPPASVEEAFAIYGPKP